MTLYEHLPLNTRKAEFNDLFMEVNERVFLRPDIEYFVKKGECFARFNSKFSYKEGYASLKDAMDKGYVFVYPAPEDSL